jgi:heme-degrading monooxygenase HmoA
MERPMPDAATCARALEALLGVLRPKRRSPARSDLTPPSAQLPMAHAGAGISAVNAGAPRAEPGYVIVWEFLAKRGQERRFEDAFGSEGEWVDLFRRAPGYLGTVLCRDARNARRYATVDYWTSPDAYRAFRLRWRDRFETIDERCRALTEREVCLGTFLLLPDRSLRPTG